MNQEDDTFNLWQFYLWTTDMVVWHNATQDSD